MKQLIQSFIIITVLFSNLTTVAEEDSSTKEKNEAMFVKALLLTERLAHILGTVKDENSSIEAAIKIESLAEDAKQIKRSAEKSGVNEMSKEERKRLVEKYKDRLTKATMKVMQLSQTLKKYPELSKAIIKLKAAMN